MKLVKTGNQISIDHVGELLESVPRGTYFLKHHQKFDKVYLEYAEPIETPHKICGNVYDIAERIIHKYDNSCHSIGALFVGQKGTGKTLLAKKIAQSINLPLICINSYVENTSDVVSFLTNSLLGNCVILFDEFDKSFPGSHSNFLLSLLDGLSNTGHLFLFTANKLEDINNKLLNRPSRIHFLIECKGLGEDDVREIGLDLLNNKSYIEDLITVCNQISICSYDVILSICNDCNLYNQTPSTCIQYMNILLEFTEYTAWLKSEDGSEKNAGFVQFYSDGSCRSDIELNEGKIIHYRDLEVISKTFNKIHCRFENYDVILERDNSDKLLRFI